MTIGTVLGKNFRPFKRGDRVTFKDNQRGTLSTNPEPGAMGWAVFLSYNGAQFTVSTTNGEVEHTK